MNPGAPALTLGQRYNPHIEEIRTRLATLASLFQPIAPLLMLVFYRLHNSLIRLDRLATKWHQNRLPTAKKRIRKPGTTPKPNTPSAHAWLIRLHQPLAQFAPRIDLLVNDPETIALCAAAPQAGRLLRPLCRMFGLTPPPHIARPPAQRKPRPKKPKKPKPEPFAEHSPAIWPYTPHRFRLRVPGLPIPSRRRKPSG